MLEAEQTRPSLFAGPDGPSNLDWLADLPQFTPLNEANELLGDRAALDAAWERDGYWFFRDVIDQAAVARLRETYLTVLSDLGHIRPDDPDAVWAGSHKNALPPYMLPLEQLAKLSPWRDFVSERSVAEFFQNLFGEPVIWMPMADLRAVQPGAPSSLFLHQDGYFYNSALAVKTAWFPVADISEDVGGLGILEGMHHQPYIHEGRPGPLFLPDPATLPRDCWRHSPMGPGDVIMFDMRTPHFGFPNRSDRFRLSLDIRFAPISAPRPIIGEVIDISEDHLSIEAGGVVTIPIDGKTWIRGGKGKEHEKVACADIREHYGKGDTVIIGMVDGAARFIRHPHD